MLPATGAGGMGAQPLALRVHANFGAETPALGPGRRRHSLRWIVVKVNIERRVLRGEG
jgi:hypothetical protein